MKPLILQFLKKTKVILDKEIYITIFKIYE